MIFKKTIIKVIILSQSLIYSESYKYQLEIRFRLSSNLLQT